MTCRRALTCALLSCVLSATAAIAHTSDRSLDIKARVLNLLFPDVVPASYFMKLTLRFGDSDTELVVIVYPPYPARPGGRSEIIRYSLADMSEGDLSRLISRMVAQNPDVTDREIAATLKVNVTRSPVDYDALDHALKNLKSVRISPVLRSVVAVDECSQYEYWYDAGQESVHYTLTCPFKNDSEDQLVRWMIGFRASLPDLMKPPSTPGPSKPD